MEKKLKICFLGNAASIHTIKWVKFFAERGHEVHLISYGLPCQKDLGRANLHILKKKIPINTWPFNTLINLPFSVVKVRKIVKKVKPDIVNIHYVTSYGQLAVLTGFHPLVVTAWGSDVLVDPKKSLKARLVVKYVFKKADLITCDAKHMKEAIIGLGALSSKIKIINFGIDTQKFSPGDKSKELKDKLGIFDSPVVISLRSLEQIYNVETLIKAVSLIIKEIPETKFIIVGKGSQEEKLKKMVKFLKISDNIRFVGQVLNEELPKYLRIADVYISTSLSDAGIAASTAEAMACELPVVITDSGENEKWINDNENGFVIPVKSPKILAEKVIYLLKNKEIREKFSKGARQVIEQRNNYYKEMEKMENIYKELKNKN